MKIAIFLLLLVTSQAKAQIYPDSFIWGAAISAHQTEGAFDGGENGDWYQFEHQTPSPISNGDNADRAVDFWHRYPEDLKIAKSLGITSLRISIAWEKVEPREGQFNQEVISHYRDILLTMKSLGIRPMVALHHCTHPLWFQAEVSWGISAICGSPSTSPWSSSTKGSLPESSRLLFTQFLPRLKRLSISLAPIASRPR
jgi:hypothetical protein